jgi:hypothetical protein
MARKPHLPDFAKMTGKLVAEAKQAIHDGAKTFATTERDMFVDEIRKQDFKDFKAFPLSARTQAMKRRLGLPLLTMIATGTYLKGIQVHEQKKIEDRNVDQIVVGIDPELPSRDAETGQLRYDMPLADVARVQEYGSERAHIPARRHWGPHFDKMVKRAKPVRKQILDEIVQAWAKVTAQP